MTTDRPSPVRHEPDYELDDTVTAESAAALKAIADDTRLTILDLLLERAATTSQLAEAMGRPKGTIGYHLGVLEAADLVRIVRTQKVRAITAKYYGRTGRTVVIGADPPGVDAGWMVRQALTEVAAGDVDEPVPIFTVRRARIAPAQAEEFAARLIELADEFAAAPRAGATVFGLLGGVYPTSLPTLSVDTS